MRTSQRLWIKFRDAKLEARFPLCDKRFHYGSMYPMCYATKKRLTEKRIKQLCV
ncbi:MAG: lysozyme inhibitor LprI family protein [Mangrovibacterium sp.]